MPASKISGPGALNIIARLFRGLGAGLWLAALLTGYNQMQFLHKAVRAEGVVLRLEAGGGSRPEIRFRTALHTVVDYPQGGLVFGYRAGDKVSVLYDPAAMAASEATRNATGNATGDACIDAPGALWALPISLVLLGSGLLLGARGVSREAMILAAKRS